MSNLDKITEEIKNDSEPKDLNETTVENETTPETERW